MKFVSEYRDEKFLRSIIKRINQETWPDSNIMEFCGGHTVAIFKYGIRELIPSNINMLSGPGCPVCVTSNYDIDKAIEIAKLDNVIFVTFGDMMRVAGSRENFFEVRAAGYDVRFVYSPLDALKIAKNNLNCNVIFFGIGFETTAPAIASSILEAKKIGLKNYFVLNSLKITISALQKVCSLGEVKINGIIGPGHVCSITGSKEWEFIQEEINVPCVISGFEQIDILQSIEILLKLIKEGETDIVNQYARSVTKYGNIKAKNMLQTVFEVVDADWRGFGIIEKSGFKIVKEFEEFDAEKQFDFSVPETIIYSGCKCDEIIRGILKPNKCDLYNKACKPEHPIGPCMVSSEGTCAAYYNYSIV